jgi:ferric-dicitrate binding protein FerR (iron transport regulator)
VDRIFDRFPRRKRKTNFLIFGIGITLASFLFTAAAAQAAPRPQEREALGSLSTAGNVYVNGSLAPSESTIFSGDTVLSSESGTATFTISGKGSVKIAPQTHIIFAGDPRYLVELTAGSIVMTSFAGATELSLKTGNFVVAPVIQTQESSSRIEKTAAGSFVIACLDGSIGVIPLQGVTGQVLRTGQTVEISSTGELGTPQEASPPPANQAAVPKKKNTEWIILAAAVGGGAAAAAAIAASGGHGQSISPSSM